MKTPEELAQMVASYEEMAALQNLNLAHDNYQRALIAEFNVVLREAKSELERLQAALLPYAIYGAQTDEEIPLQTLQSSDYGEVVDYVNKRNVRLTTGNRSRWMVVPLNDAAKLTLTTNQSLLNEKLPR